MTVGLLCTRVASVQMYHTGSSKVQMFAGIYQRIYGPRIHITRCRRYGDNEIMAGGCIVCHTSRHEEQHHRRFMSFGTGGTICKSSIQKLNTKISTEAEFVRASDYLPNVIWVQMFLKAQGHVITDSFLEQDHNDKSAIKLKKNGRMSAGPKSRHIDIRYFWIKDHIKANENTIQHCPTLLMMLAFFLQNHCKERPFFGNPVT